MGLTPEEIQAVREGLDKPPPEQWTFTPEHPEVIGRVLRVEHTVSEYGPFPILVLEIENGTEVGVACFHDVLKNGLKRKGVQIGSVVGIRCKGQVPNKTPGRKPYWDYDVFVLGGGGPAALDAAPSLMLEAPVEGVVVEESTGYVEEEPAPAEAGSWGNWA